MLTPTFKGQTVTMLYKQSRVRSEIRGAELLTRYCHVSEHFWEFHLRSSLFGFILYGLSSALFQNHASAAAEQALSACRATLGLGM